jgi:hypothetical protein
MMNVQRNRFVAIIVACVLGSLVGSEMPSVVSFGGGGGLIFVLALAAGISALWTP